MRKNDTEKNSFMRQNTEWKLRMQSKHVIGTICFQKKYKPPGIINNTEGQMSFS